MYAKAVRSYGPPRSNLLELHDRSQRRIASFERFRLESLNELTLVAAQSVALVPDYEHIVYMRQHFAEDFCSLNVCKNPFSFPA